MTKEMKTLLLESYRGKDVIKYIELLERENKALAIEGEEKCDKLERLEKALAKACEKIARMDKDLAQIIHGSNTEDYASAREWKEWCFDENC